MTRTLTTLFLGAALIAGGCGDDESVIGDDAGDDTVDPPVGRTLTGSHLVNFLHLDQTVLSTEVVDLWDTLIEAHVPTEAGGWEVVPGIGHRDGTFEIAGLPDGPVWLRIAVRPFGELYLWTAADHVDFDEPVLGPSDPPRGDDGDELQIEVGGLAAWQAGDSLSWFAPDDLILGQDLLSGSGPAPGATEVDEAIDWTGRVLADIGDGEASLVIQYRDQELIEGSLVTAPFRAATVAIHQTPGTSGVLAGTLADPPALDYRLAYARDAFEAERTAIHPTRAGASWYHDWSLTALPMLVDGEVWIGVEYPLARLVDPSVLEGTTSIDLGTLAIPNPFPRGWITDSYVVAYPLDLPMPDGSPYTLEAAIGTRRMEFGDAPVGPGITPIRAPTIAGRDGFEDLDGVGVTPELAWDAPATGTATAYRVLIIEAVPNPPFPYRPGWYQTTELWVPGDVTAVRVPVDVLVPGTTYSALVRAFDQDGQDIETRPYRTAGRYAFADALLGRFTP